ncbi:MAG: pyridoxamine 5'-phosphate oxidase family protein [Propionibacteriales bacterium]|nr:pyridoxamine 5'-phosphate oxidase family protein [Propionibacteriales bacterium]
MTTTGPQARGRFEELESDECIELLSAKHVGRVAFCRASGPQVFPVNYVLWEDSVLFRIAPDTQLARHLADARVAFQVDEIDDFLQCGWSVLVVGQAHHIPDPDGFPANRLERPEPWASGARTQFVRIDREDISGRRVQPM